MAKLIKYPNLKMVLSMAVTRDRWIDGVNNILRGALREFSKQKFSEKIGYTGHNWNAEIETLLQGARNAMDKKKVKTKIKFDRKKAFQNALFGGQAKVVAAKNILITKHKLTPAQYDKLQKTVLKSENLLVEMIRDYLSGAL